METQEDPMKNIIVLLCLLLSSFALLAEQIVISPYANDIRLISSNPNDLQLEYTLGSFDRQPVTINGNTWYDLSLKKSGLTLEAGMPQVPVLATSLIIPGTAAMQLNTTASEYVELTMPVAPSKGNLTRDIDPATVPYTFDSFYQGNGSYPEQTAYLTEPFIIRDYRGITVRIQPFVYYPSTGTLRVYTKLVLSVSSNGTDLTNAITTPKTSYSRLFEDIYQNLFLNFADAKYPSLGEEGRILVIKNSMFDAALQPWVDWKRQNGYTVDVVDVSVAGPSANQMLTYIQNQYNLNNGLMFLQLVGDAPQVPTLSSGGGGSDPSFALLAGGDSYPDIYVGRFSAQTVAELQTQVQRSIYYERDIAVGADWLQKAFGIASNEGGGSQGDNGESDQTHIENIRTDLLAYGYTLVDQIYQNTGATAAMITTAVNNGRGFANYCGHGADTYWVTTGFSNTNVNALTNDNKLPFICSVACVNGNFVSQTCFAESWLRAVNESTGAPNGAIAFYGSTINQGWNPPMRAQDEVTDLLVGNYKHRVGSLLFNGAAKMIEVYGTSGVSEYKCWTIFGDASLMIRTKNPTAITATYNPIIFIGMSTFTVQTEPGARVSLSANGTLYGTTTADLSGNAVVSLFPVPLEPLDLTLTITAFDKQTYMQTVQVLPSSGPYMVLDDATFSDDNDGIFGYGETVYLDVDISNIGSETAQNVMVSVSTDDQYATVQSPAMSLGNIASGSNGSAGSFNILLANNIPDQHEVVLNILIQADGGNSYTYQRSFLGSAPAIGWGNLQVDDSQGNNNGRVDAGENVSITFNLTNNGHCAATNITSTLVVNGVAHLITPVVTEIPSLPVGATGQIIYNITFSSQIPTGTPVQLTAMTMFGEYLDVHTYTVVVGLVMENFDNGFANFPWSFVGGTWTAASGSFNGSLAAKSPAINHSASTSMSLTMTNPQNGEISFWKKVSSEQNYDFLKFYINGTLKNQWSGTTDVWSQVTYAVPAGTNIYKWEYMKDSGTSSGSDCAWIDDVIFPGTGGQAGTPAFTIDTQSVDFGITQYTSTATQQITISNTGTASMLGTISTASPFSVGDPNMPSQTLTYVLAIGEALTFNLNFTPPQQMQYTGSLVITSDDPTAAETTIPLTGVGGIVANDDLVNPVLTALGSNYPNPFNPTTTISYSIRETTPVEIYIYNMLGQKVKTLVSGTVEAGNHSVVWNGQDNNNRPVASGVYFFKMHAGKYTSTKKMILMK